MSSKSIAQKLQIKEKYDFLLANEPKDYRSMLGKLPANVAVLTEPTKPVDVIQVFVTSKKDLESQLIRLKSALRTPRGLLWVTYPKGTSEVKTDVNRDIIREFALKFGLQAVALVSIDETWSALRLKIV